MGLIKPMEPVSHDIAKDDITYPLFAQPFVDGVRFLVERISETEVDFYDGKRDFNAVLGHLEGLFVAIMADMPAGSTFDGYLYRPGWDLARITAATLGLSVDTRELEAWLYDLPSEPGDAAHRLHRLDHYVGHTPTMVSGPIFRAPFEVFKKAEEIEKYHDIFVDRGGDGILLKNADNSYEGDKSSNSFQIYRKG